jgi:MtaA/CmuA family methyltransferase
MTPRDRYNRTLAGEAVDHLARTPILMQFAAEHIGSDYGQFAADHRVLVEANRRCAADFHFDQVSSISDAYRETQGFGGEVEYVPDGPPRCEHPPLLEARELGQLKRPDPLRSTRMRDRVDAVAAMAAHPVLRDYSVLGWVEGPAAEAADLRGVTNFMMDILDDEAYACELMDRCLEVGIAFAKAQIDVGSDTIGIGDAICSQMSPDLYERLVQPREAALVNAIHAAGAKVRLHICGNITHLLPGIAALGIDHLDVDHMVDPRTVRKAVGGRVAVGGNLDPVSAILKGTPASIRAAVRRCYAEAGNPFVVNAGCEIPSGTPQENLLALCEPLPYQA